MLAASVALLSSAVGPCHPLTSGEESRRPWASQPLYGLQDCTPLLLASVAIAVVDCTLFAVAVCSSECAAAAGGGVCTQHSPREGLFLKTHVNPTFNLWLYCVNPPTYTLACVLFPSTSVWGLTCVMPLAMFVPIE